MPPLYKKVNSMDLMDLLEKAGAGNSLGELAGTLGLGDSDAKNLIGALSPALVAGLEKQSESTSSLDSLQNALSSGDHRRYLEQPELMRAEETRDDGNRILGHLLGSKEVSRGVASRAAEETGIDSELIKKALPLVAGLAMGALSKKSSVDSLLGFAKKLF